MEPAAAETIKIKLGPEQFERARTRLETEQRMIRLGQGGVFNYNTFLGSVSFRYNYNGRALVIEVIRRSGMISAELVEAKVREWFTTV